MLRAIPVNSLANSLFSDFDRFFARTDRDSQWAVPTDVIRFEDRVEIHFDLPGASVENIDLTVEDRQLNLLVEREAPAYEGGAVISRERRSGSMHRQLYLSENLDPDGLKASYTDGVLTVTLPVAEAVKPRKVAIFATHPAIEATD